SSLTLVAFPMGCLLSSRDVKEPPTPSAGAAFSGPIATATLHNATGIVDPLRFGGLSLHGPSSSSGLRWRGAGKMLEHNTGHACTQHVPGVLLPPTLVLVARGQHAHRHRPALQIDDPRVGPDAADRARLV